MSTAAQGSPARKMLALAGITAGAAGFTASLTGTYLGMRDFMATGNAFCASGGPFEIANECPQGVALLGASMFGLFVFWGVYAGLTAYVRAPVLASSLFMWGILFALLGWNFMEFGIFDHQSEGLIWGWAISGVTFWLMALGGLIPAAIMAVKWVATRDEPEQPLWNSPVTMATVQAPPAMPEPKAPPTVPTRLVLPPKGSD